MSDKRGRLITGWRQVKPLPGSPKRRLFPLPVAKPPPATPGEAANDDRLEPEDGSIVPP